MIKLSRSGWNNIIIFAVMGFILLINLTNKNVFSPEQSGFKEASFLGPSAVILTLKINQEITIERIGKTWRATPAKLSAQHLTQMMNSWQQTEAKLLKQAPELDLSLALVVTVELAGQTQASVLSLLATDNELLIFNHTLERWFELPLAIYAQLLPDQVFANE